MDGKTRLSPAWHLVLFFALAFGFTWLFWLPDALAKRGVLPSSPLTNLGFIGAFGPLVAAMVMTVAFEGVHGLRALFRRALDHRFPRAWWLAILLLFPALVILAFYISAGIDGVIPPFPSELDPPWIIVFVFFSVLFLSGPFEEEFGWRGYALPRLQGRTNALVSSLVLGFFWATWHFPQFLVPNNGMFYKTPIWTFIPTVIAATVLFTWVYNNTGGSLLAMLLMHTMFNLSMFVFPVLDTSHGYLVILVLFTAAAAVVVGIYGPRELRRGDSRQASA